MTRPLLYSRAQERQERKGKEKPREDGQLHSGIRETQNSLLWARVYQRDAQFLRECSVGRVELLYSHKRLELTLGHWEAEPWPEGIVGQRSGKEGIG